MILCVASNPSIDKLFEVDRLQPGRIHRPTGFVQVAGGKGLNVARAAASLGAEVRAVAILRGHAGRWIEEALSSSGVMGRYVWTGGETRGSLSVADAATVDLTEFYEDGAEITMSAWAEFEQAAADAVRGVSWMTVSGSLPKGAPRAGYRDLLMRVRNVGSSATALDAAGEPLAMALSAGPGIVKVNAGEASELLGKPVDTRNGAIDAVARVREMAGGEGHAGLVTLGAQGVVLVTPKGVSWEGSLHVRGRYPVGSGDAFLAGLVVGLDRGLDWPLALRLALGAAAANAEKRGAGALDRVRAEVLAAQADVTRL